jgi:hypothetical protein
MVCTIEDAQLRNRRRQEERSSHQKIQQLTTRTDINLLQLKTILKLVSQEYFLIITI